jgi:predicted DNA-binding protein
MPKEDASTVQTAVRLPAEWMGRLQAIAERLSRPGIPVKVSEAIRAAIAEGLVVLEAQLQIQPSEASEAPKRRR